MNFIDLKEQYRLYREEMNEEIQKVLDSAQFIMGPSVAQLELELARHSGARHAVACSSGTDALLLGLLAKGLAPGDEVLVPDFTFYATAEVVSFLGATPVFVDVESDTFNMDPSLLEARITDHTRGIIPVSLFGQCADIDRITEIARRHGLWVFEDAAQSYGAASHGKRSCSLTEIAATSFFPAKPLGCYGDGGAFFTSDDGIAAKVRKLLNHGQSERYKHALVGMNGRMDTLQAAILLVKLRHFDDEMERKRNAADAYNSNLNGLVCTPKVRTGNVSVWAQYTVRSPERDRIIKGLQAKGIPTAIHYPIPLHAQAPYASRNLADTAFPVSVRLCKEVFSLPMHPFLADGDIRGISACIAETLR
jgi:UDP-2-acetamido-2-deoxy-ribo-hexuluronate aminotransferase